MRRLLMLGSAIVFVDVAFYSAIAPLLPGYVEDLGLSKVQAGVLSASYAAGSLAASLPAGFVASRVGPRRTVISGLVVLGVASLVFGVVDRLALLDAARFTQGAAGALIWAGALTWLIAMSAEERRGSVIGTVLGTAVAGALLGPAIGALAASIGTEVVFGSVLVVTTFLAIAATRLPDAMEPETQSPRHVVKALLSRPMVEAAAFVGIPSIMFGAIELLVPLRIDALGGGHAVIAGGFIVGAGLEATLAPIAGGLSDRVGRRAPYVIGLSVCAAAMIAIALAQTLGAVLGALVVTSLGAGLCFAPALTLLSDVAEATNLHQGFVAGVSNMAWASGQVLGGIGGGVAASLAGNTLPSIAIAALLLLTVLYALYSMDPTATPEPARS